MVALKHVFLTILFFLFPFLSPTSWVEGVVGQPQAVDRDLSFLVFSGLLKYGKEGNLLEDLAADFSVSENGKIYSVRLKEGLRWHDGAPLTTEDVIYTFSQREEFQDVEIEKVDNFSLRFVLKEPFSPFPHLLTQSILPKHYPHLPPLKPVGSGPYAVERVEKGGEGVEKIVLRRQRGKGPQNIVFRFFKSEEELKTVAKLGEVNAFVLDDFSWPSFKTYKIPLLGRYFGLFFNVRKKLFKDKKFRRTLVCLTPKEKIIKEALKGKGQKIEGPLPYGWAEEKIEVPPCPVPRSFSEGGQTFTLSYPQGEEYQKIARILKEEWGKAGIDFRLKELSPQEMEEAIEKKDFEVLLLGREVGRDPDRYTFWHSKNAEKGPNLTGYKNLRADKALEKGRRCTEEKERRKHYIHFQEVLLEDAPAVFLYRPVLEYQVSERKRIDWGRIFNPSERLRGILEANPQESFLGLWP